MPRYVSSSQTTPNMVNGLAEASFKDIPEIFEVCALPDSIERVFEGILTIRFYHNIQVELGESLTARTEALCTWFWSFVYLVSSGYNIFSASFRELGPPDLCHVVKSSSRQVAREVLG